MTKNQKYIIIIIIALLAVIVFSNNKTITQLPNAIGEPLELIVIKNEEEKNKQEHNLIKDFLSINIGVSPQPELVLNIIEISSINFKGIIKRHQNLLFLVHSDSFSIKQKKDVFALGQQAIFIHYKSYDEIKKNKKKIESIVNTIKQTEIDRQTLKYKKRINTTIKDKVEKSHNISVMVPKDFFIAHSDAKVTWIRHETPKISQGILIANLDSTMFRKRPSKAIQQTNSIIQNHIFGPKKNSYMTLDKDAPITTDTIIINNLAAIKLQSLWRMENDFMGGVFNTYYFPFQENDPQKIIYTYVYAPGEKKKIPLMHLEAIMKNIKFK